MKPSICVDLDGTLADFASGWQGIETIGEPFPGAVEFTKKLVQKYRIVIFTCRCSQELNDGKDVGLAVDYVRKWLDTHDFAWDEIYTGGGKPIADAYVDDRALTCRPQFDQHAYINVLAKLDLSPT